MGSGTTTALAKLLRATRSGVVPNLCRRRGVSLLVLFGSAVAYLDRSRSTGDPAPRDLDVAVLPAGAFEPLDFLTDLFELTGTEHIDLMRLDRAGVVARQRALTQGRCLYEASPRQFAEAQIAAAMEYFDTAPMRALQLEALSQA